MLSSLGLTIPLLVIIAAAGCSGAAGPAVAGAGVTIAVATSLPADQQPLEEQSSPTVAVRGLEPTANPAQVAMADDQPGVLKSSIGGEHSLLKVRLQSLGRKGGRVPLKNGGAIRLEEDLIAEIFIDPYPTNTLTAWLDLYLHDDSGAPVTDAKVAIDFDMFSMAHGPFFSVADDSANGHYVFRLDYIMFGPWDQLVQIRPPDSGVEHRLEVVVVAVP